MTIRQTNTVQARCTANRQYRYVLEWLPERHYVSGAQIELRSHCLRAFLSWKYIEMSMDRTDITFRWKAYPTVSELRENWDRVLFRARLPYGVRRGEPVTIRLTAVPPIWAGIDNVLSLWTIDVPSNLGSVAALPPEPAREAGSECTLSVVAGPVERLSVYCRPASDEQGEVRACLVPEDRFGNPSAFDSPLPARLEWNERRWQKELQHATTVMLEPLVREVGRLTVSLPMDRLGPEENVANGVRENAALVVTGNPVWRVLPGQSRPAFGEFHWHTDISSDGQRPIEEALRCARDYLNLDFAAPGDHNPRGADWQRTASALEAANCEDEFATFFGWENGTDRGHENYYFCEADHPLVCGGSAGIVRGRPDELAPTLREIYRQHDFVAIPHHTNAVAETRRLDNDAPFWHPYPWLEPEAYIQLVEIMQCRGNQERNEYSDAWRGWHQNNSASVQDALALGHKIGFTGGTDNHCGWPGRAYAKSEGPLGANHEPKSVILTGVWTERVERRALFAALKQRHTWAVWDTRALVEYTLNGARSGDEIVLDLHSLLVAHIRISAEDALLTVELVSEGETIWQSAFAALDVEQEVSLGRAYKSTYVYLRALQRDGGIIYASPVFVTVQP
jgi:hypothetical protein